MNEPGIFCGNFATSATFGPKALTLADLQAMSASLPPVPDHVVFEMHPEFDVSKIGIERSEIDEHDPFLVGIRTMFNRALPTYLLVAHNLTKRTITSYNLNTGEVSTI